VNKTVATAQFANCILFYAFHVQLLQLNQPDNTSGKTFASGAVGMVIQFIQSLQA